METERVNLVHQIKTFCKRPVASLLFHGGYYRSQLRQYACDQAIILMYHRVNGYPRSEHNGAWYTGFERGVSCEQFESHMHFIQEEMNPIALWDLVDHLRKSKPLPPRAVVVTFDDGYKDNFIYAYPILKKYQIPASIFVATGFIESSRTFWWDQICEMLRRTRQKRLDLGLISHLGRESGRPGPLSLPLMTSQQRIHAAEMLIERMGSMSPAWLSETLLALQPALEVSDPGKQGLDLMLTWRQIQEMSQNGIWIEAHTHSHPNLALLDSSRVVDELRESKRLIEEKTNRPVYGLAYPGGHSGTYTGATVKVAQDIGFRYACITEHGSISQGADLFALKRIGVGNLPLPMLIHDLMYAYIRS